MSADPILQAIEISKRTGDIRPVFASLPLPPRTIAALQRFADHVTVAKTPGKRRNEKLWNLATNAMRKKMLAKQKGERLTNMAAARDVSADNNTQDSIVNLMKRNADELRQRAFGDQIPRGI